MSAIFLQQDVEQLFKDKYVLVMGGSNQRSIYKDLIQLVQENNLLTDKALRLKGTSTCVNDKLVEGGLNCTVRNGTGYCEVREYITDHHFFQFVFLTRCYNSYVANVLKKLSTGDPKPDVIIINSCLLDITRYGDNAIDEYKENLDKFFVAAKELLPKCLIIWTTNPPVAPDAKGGVFVPEVEHLKNSKELDVLEANYMSSELAKRHGHDVIDIHYFLRHQVHRRAEDGIHWDMTAHRRITNLILSHVAEAWDRPIPDHLQKRCIIKDEDSNAEKKNDNDKDENSNVTIATKDNVCSDDESDLDNTPPTPDLKSSREKLLWRILRNNAEGTKGGKKNGPLGQCAGQNHTTSNQYGSNNVSSQSHSAFSGVGMVQNVNNGWCRGQNGPSYQGQNGGYQNANGHRVLLPLPYQQNNCVTAVGNYTGMSHGVTPSYNCYNNYAPNRYHGAYENTVNGHWRALQTQQQLSWSYEAQMNRYGSENFQQSNECNQNNHFGQAWENRTWEPYQDRGYCARQMQPLQRLHNRFAPYGRAQNW